MNRAGKIWTAYCLVIALVAGVAVAQFPGHTERISAPSGSSSTVTAPATGAGTDTCTGSGCAIGAAGMSTDGGFTSAIAGHSVTLLQDPADNLPTIQVDGTGRYVFGSGLAPKANNGQSLGLTSLRWTTLFANGVDLNVASGSVSIQTLTGAKTCLGTSGVTCLSSDGTTITAAAPLSSTGAFIATSIKSSSSYIWSTGTFALGASGKDALFSTAPTIGSGFGSSPSIVASNGTAAFQINVGTGGSATNGTITLPTAATGWSCTCEDVTTISTTVARCRQTALGTTTSVNIGNYTSADVAGAWVASDKVLVNCMAY